MRVPISWLKEFVEIDMSIDELAQRLTLAGLEVGAVDRVGIEGADLPWDPEKIVIGNILEVRRHPNADRLVLADVDYGGPAPHTVVTGAPNLFPYVDQGPLQHPLKGVFAREGAELYDGHAEGQVKMVLKGRKVRGIMSDAMLCSEKELGLSDDHEGIIILPGDAPVGAPLRDYLGDAVLDIDITPNVARALSILGVAREVAAITGQQLRLPAMPLEENGPPVEQRVRVTVETPDLCPRFTATLIEGVTIGPSPLWMQRRLMLAGMRPINNIVDISNYVMLELGEPNHPYDADKVADQHLLVRLARAGERLTTLDGRTHQLDTRHLLVCDPRGPLGLAGVMGGADSEVSESTTRVLLEAAIWEPVTIRRTAREFRLPSEASRRFERGVDYEVPPLMQRRALSLMQQIAGGTVARGMVDVYPRPWRTIELDLPPREIERIVGITLSAAEIADLLRRLELGCEVVTNAGGQEVVHVVVPSFRQDITILADLCEEVARIYGYDRIPSLLLSGELPPQRSNPSLELEQRIRDLLAGSGLNEAMTYSLTNMASVARIDPAEADPSHHVKLANPLTPEREYMRRSLFPTLLEAFAANLREYDRVCQFEIGRVYLPRAGQLLPDEPRRLAIVMGGRRAPLSWHTPESEVMDFFDLKGVIEMLIERLHCPEHCSFVPLTNDPRFHPGRAAALVADGRQIGALGELHPALCDRLGISVARAMAAELDLEALIELAQPLHYTAISRLPATYQDIAVVVDHTVPAGRVAAVIRKYAGADLESLTLFDVYEGPQVGEGRRSLAFRLAFRSMERTLSDSEVNSVRAQIVSGLERELGATIRS